MRKCSLYIIFHSPISVHTILSTVNTQTPFISYPPAPRNCLEALAANGNKSSINDIYFARGTYSLRCVPALNGAKFYFHVRSPTVNVSGPWVQGSLSTNFEYYQSQTAMRHLMDGASKCRQTISYKCLQTRITNNARPCNNRDVNWPVTCDGGQCECDQISERVMKYDRQNFDGLEYLPLKRIIINGVSNINSSLEFTVGPVECFEG